GATPHPGPATAHAPPPPPSTRTRRRRKKGHRRRDSPSAKPKKRVRLTTRAVGKSVTRSRRQLTRRGCSGPVAPAGHWRRNIASRLSPRIAAISPVSSSVGVRGRKQYLGAPRGRQR